MKLQSSLLFLVLLGGCKEKEDGFGVPTDTDTEEGKDTADTGVLPVDEDGDGFHEVHVNTMEGFWSLLRSWLRPHRGISQESLPLYLGFFEFAHNSKARGKRLLPSLLELLLA